MKWRVWPRKFIQPSSAAALRRRNIQDDGVGDAFALGLFLLIGVIALASTATSWRDDAQRTRASDGNLALSAKPTVKPFARAELTKTRRPRLAMARQR